jgi:hypothetical protein
MRTDEHGNECPATLGEYRDLAATGLPNNEAVRWLDNKIKVSPGGRDERVLAPDSQMREFLMRMMYNL